MRVIAGRFRSRTLQSLPGDDTRPTYDRLKETLFNVLAAAGKLDGAVFFDLFAGTGAIGIEALSRGAVKAYFVESGKKAAQVIRANLQTLQLEECAEVHERPVADALRLLAEAGLKADIIFLDPPYKMQGAYEQVLRIVGQSPLLSESGVLVAEHEKRFDPGDGLGTLRRYRRLDQGDSSLSFYRGTVNAGQVDAEPK
jgi:16S rRNA (guanine(966)-N(2))-methyltransferase RsmD